MTKPKHVSSDPICYRFPQRVNCATRRRTTTPHHDSTAGPAAAPTAPTLGAGFAEGRAA